jgi:hypothetical protein
VIIRAFWNHCSGALKACRGAEKRISDIKRIMSEHNFIKGKYVNPPPLPADVADTEQGKALAAALKKLAASTATRSSEIELCVAELQYEQRKPLAAFAHLWTVALTHCDPAFANFAILGKDVNATPASPVFPPGDAREARTATHFLPGLRSLARALRQRYDDYVVKLETDARIAADKARKQKEDKDKHDTDALRDKVVSVAAVTHQAALQAANEANQLLEKRLAALEHANSQTIAQLLAHIDQQSANRAGDASDAPSTHRTSNAPHHNNNNNNGKRSWNGGNSKKKAHNGSSASTTTTTTATPAPPPHGPPPTQQKRQSTPPQQVHFADNGTPHAVPRSTQAAHADATGSTPAPKPAVAVMRTAAGQPWNASPVSPSKPASNTRAKTALQRSRTNAAAATATAPTAATAASVVVSLNNNSTSTDPDAHIPRSKSPRSGNVFAPLANAPLAMDNEQEHVEDDQDEDPHALHAAATQQKRSPRGKRRARSTTSTGGSKRDDSHL